MTGAVVVIVHLCLCLGNVDVVQKLMSYQTYWKRMVFSA